MAGEVRRTCWC